MLNEGDEHMGGTESFALNREQLSSKKEERRETLFLRLSILVEVDILYWHTSESQYIWEN